MECLNCKTPVAQTPGKRPKLYCSETCRVAFFRLKKAGEGIKKGKGRPKKSTSEIQNTDIILPGGLGNIKFQNGMGGEIVKSLSNSGSVTLTIAPYPESYDASKLPDTTMDVAGKYAVAVDHSKEPSKTVITIYDKKKGFKGIAPTIERRQLPVAEITSMGEAAVRKADQDTRKVLNPDDPKTKQKKEPAEGTNAFYLKYGAFNKKDILK